MTRRWLGWLALGLGALLLSGCAGVTVSSISPSSYLAERRGDMLTTGRLSQTAREVLRVAGIATCKELPVACREAVGASDGLSDEQRQSALSELWLETALAASEAPGEDEAALHAWLETARHAYAYLFFTARRPGERAFEDRQTQVRDYYNYATQQTITRLFKTARADRQAHRPTDPLETAVAGWQISSHIDALGLPADSPLPDELLAASSLKFTGLRNTYRRDGFGAELVAVMPPPQPVLGTPPAPVQPAFSATRFPAITALLGFAGGTLPEVLATRQVQLILYDPYRSTQVQLAGERLPLAANFTAGYGLWLARSGFAQQSIRTLFGLSEGLVRPRIELMQPYDPSRRTIVMLHGLASSPEAWINVANEVLGDEPLRQNYQVWQVYYPSNAPLALNQKTIRDALLQTLAQLDPDGAAKASQDMVLVGHSMGGVLARLLVSSSGDALWEALPAELKGDARATRTRERLAPYLSFDPLPQVTRTIFIAAPHRGTPVATGQLARRIANLVTLPLAMLEQIGDIAGLWDGQAPDGTDAGPQRVPNGIDNLRDNDPFVRAAAHLPISPRVRVHSIIGQADPRLALAESSDGIVPYASAHLAGAESERVIASEHSVQEHPLAILEIRRILREALQ